MNEINNPEKKTDAPKVEQPPEQRREQSNKSESFAQNLDNANPSEKKDSPTRNPESLNNGDAKQKENNAEKQRDYGVKLDEASLVNLQNSNERKTNETGNPEKRMEASKVEQRPEQLREQANKSESYARNLDNSNPDTSKLNTQNKPEQADRMGLWSDWKEARSEAQQEKLKERYQKELLPEAEQQQKSYIQEKGLDKYISEEKLNERYEDTTKFQTTNEMRQHPGYSDGTVGLNDGYRSFVEVDNRKNPETSWQDTKATVMHENFHQFSNNRIDGEMRSGIKEIEPSNTAEPDKVRNEGFNEAITQMYTVDAMRQEHPDYKGENCDYCDASKYAEKFYSFEGNKELFDEAYFQNKPEMLREHFDSACWDGYFAELSENMDKATDGDPENADKKREALDNIKSLYDVYEVTRQ